MSFRILDAKKHALGNEAVRALAEIETHPKVMQWDVDVHTKDPNEMCRLFKEFFERLPDDQNQISLVGEFGGKVVGFLGIHRMSNRMTHVGVVGITLHPDYWGKGFGAKLLEAGIKLAKSEGVFRLEADTLVKNEAMRRVAEKFGFELEGVRKMRFNMNGRFEDEALLALLLD